MDNNTLIAIILVIIIVSILMFNKISAAVIGILGSIAIYYIVDGGTIPQMDFDISDNTQPDIIPQTDVTPYHGDINAARILKRNMRTSVMKPSDNVNMRTKNQAQDYDSRNVALQFERGKRDISSKTNLPHKMFSMHKKMYGDELDYNEKRSWWANSEM